MTLPRCARGATALVNALALALLISACGGGSDVTATSGASAPTASAAAQVASSLTSPVITADPSATAVGSPTLATVSGDLTVFAAASLTESFNRIKTDLEAANPGLTITYNFAGSQALVTQLTQGARADVFASANVAQMQAAQNGGVVEGEPTTFVRNQLAIIVPKGNPAGIAGPADLAKNGVKLVIGNPDVPVGKYFLQVLDNVANDPTLGADVRDKTLANVVSQESDVKQVVSKVQLGEADAGVVYVTDVTEDVAQDVTTIVIPDPLNVVAEYPIAVVTGGNPDLGQFFIDYLLSPAGQRVLSDAGFAPPR
jgi:molybdate transport system substrate-binding protein